MRRAKTTVNLDDIGVALVGNRKTRKGEILLQVAERTQATLLASTLKEKIGDCAKVRYFVPSAMVLIMGMEDSTLEEELKAALRGMHPHLADIPPQNYRRPAQPRKISEDHNIDRNCG